MLTISNDSPGSSVHSLPLLEPAMFKMHEMPGLNNDLSSLARQ